MIKLTNIYKSFGRKKVLQNINFEIKKGAITGLLGPNGAGKTTTMRIIAGILKPDRGSVQINNLYLNQNPLKVKSIIGYLPEDNPLYEFLTVKEYLKFIGAIKKGKNLKKQMEKLVKELGLDKVLTEKIEYLSRGFKQRVGLAASLLGDPKILILDEATSGLDPNQRIEIRNFIKTLKKTVLFSSHILPEVQQICSEVVIINNGKIIAQGKIDKLLKTTPRLKVGIKNATEAKIKNYFQRFSDINLKIETKNNLVWLSLETQQKINLREIIWAMIKKNRDWQIYEMEEKKQNLEEIFNQLTKDE